MGELDLTFENMPKQMGFKIDVDKLDNWDYWPNPEDHDSGNPTLSYAFSSNSLDVVLGEMPPGSDLGWHTHEPHTAQLYYLLEGRMRANYKDNDGEIHTVESDAADDELVYLPAGAHNLIENPGDEMLRFLSFKEGGGTAVGRLEHIVGDPSEHYDPNVDPVKGLEIDPMRGLVFETQDDAIEEW